MVSFLTKNSSVVVIFSFLKTFPAFLKPPQEESKNIEIIIIQIFSSFSFIKKPVKRKVIIPKEIKISATLNVNQ